MKFFFSLIIGKTMPCPICTGALISTAAQGAAVIAVLSAKQSKKKTKRIDSKKQEKNKTK
jgi:predicted transporter